MQPRRRRCHSVMTTSGFLTFVVALHQVRLSDLYVEGFVLLVLLIVNYSHLDGFTEEEEEGGPKQEQGGKGGGKRTEKECRDSKEKDRLETGNLRGNTAKQHSEHPRRPSGLNLKM